jgi:lysophospholipase L1-like esterase
MASGWGLENVNRVIQHAPDVVILGWGVNDASGKVPPEQFEANMRGQIEAIRKVKPATEFIVVTMISAHPDWVAYGGTFYQAYQERFRELDKINGVAVADLHTLWQAMLTRKRFQDIIANGVNHPNDFGHRVMAQVVLAGLIKESI